MNARIVEKNVQKIIDKAAGKKGGCVNCGEGCKDCKGCKEKHNNGN